MKQRDVTKLVWANAAAMVRDADLGELFGEDFCEESGVTVDQMERAQRAVADQCQRKATLPGDQAHE